MRDEGGQINQSVGRRRKVSILGVNQVVGGSQNRTGGESDNNYSADKPDQRSAQARSTWTRIFKRRTLVGTTVSADRDKVEGGRVGNRVPLGNY